MMKNGAKKAHLGWVEELGVGVGEGGLISNLRRR